MKDDHSSPAVSIEYIPADADPVQSLENLVRTYARDHAASLALITSALARIERRLENNSLGFEDVNARVDRVEVNDIETRRQLALLKPSKKVKRK